VKAWRLAIAGPGGQGEPTMDTQLRFGPFEWCPVRRQLIADGERPVSLGARAFDLLGVLLDNRDRVMSKGDLIDRVWPDTVVEENNLSVQVSVLRKVLGDTAIATVPGRGYKWALPVEAPAAAAPVRRTKPSIAVLPFANLSGSADKDYFADGLAEDIVASLSRSPWLFVVASSSSLQFRDSQIAPAAACQALGVQYLLRGSVRSTEQRLRIAVELIAGNGDEVVWAERHDRPAADLFEVQDEIAAKIVGALEPAFLQREEQRSVTRIHRDLQQWDLLMRARWHYWRSTQRHSLEAKQLLEQAIRLHPADGAALSLLAFCLATDVWSGWATDPRSAALEARQLATRAVAIDDRDAFAHFTLAVTLLSFGELDGAIAEQRRALALYPHFAAAAAELGRLLAFSGETEEGCRLIRQAMTDSPTDPRRALWIFGLGIASFVDRRYADAAAHARSAITLRRDWFFNHLLLASSLAHLDDNLAAHQALAEGLRLLPTLSLSALRAGHPFRRDADRTRYIEGLRAAGWVLPGVVS
jgi:TolB-like protein